MTKRWSCETTDLSGDGVWRVMADLCTVRQQRVTQRLHSHVNVNQQLHSAQPAVFITALVITSNNDKKLSCCRQTAQRFLSLNILLRHCCDCGVCKSLLVFQWHYVCISYSFWDIQREKWPDLETGGMGRSRSLKMAPFSRPCTTFYRSAIVNTALSCTIFQLNNIVTLKSGLEVTQGHIRLL